MRFADILELMPDALPPPLTDDGVTEPGWYPDPNSPDLLRWWDGEEWSETDVKLPGDDGYPWWHGSSLVERFGPFTRIGSIVNVVVCSVIVGGVISNRPSVDGLGIIPLVGLEVVFVGIAVRAWWRR